MCLSAIYWAKMKKLYFGCTRFDAEKIGFDDKFIYDAIKGTAKKKKVTLIPTNREDCLESFKKWEVKGDKKSY